MHTSTRLIADDTFYPTPVCLKCGAVAFQGKREEEIGGTPVEGSGGRQFHLTW